MQHRRPPLPVIILVILLLAAGIYYGFRTLNANGDGQLNASGTIELTTMNVSPELAGKVKEVFAGEGQTVKASEPLLSLDDSLLAAQRIVAQSAVDSARSALLTAQRSYDMAQAQYDATLTAARTQDGGRVWQTGPARRREGSISRSGILAVPSRSPRPSHRSMLPRQLFNRRNRITKRPSRIWTMPISLPQRNVFLMRG